MYRVLRALGDAAGGMSNVYKIVFTGLLLYELVRFRFRRKPYAEDSHNNPGCRGYRAGPALGPQEKR